MLHKRDQNTKLALHQLRCLYLDLDSYSKLPFELFNHFCAQHSKTFVISNIYVSLMFQYIHLQICALLVIVAVLNTTFVMSNSCTKKA